MQNFTILRYLVGVLLGTGLLGLHPGQAWAQTYQLPTSGTATYTTCTGTLYDDGGVSGVYSANANGAITLQPGNTGSKIKLEFTSFNVETSYDKVNVYDGNSTAATLIGSYDLGNPPGTLYATTTSGALTVALVSDGIIQYSGFAATISCVTSIPQPDLTVQSATVSPTSAVAGNTISASSLVYNLSGTTANSSNLGYYLSTDNVLSSNDVLLGSASGTALSVGQSSSRYSSLTIPATTTSGTYYVLFAADYLNQVAESNENNNVAAVAITVQPATPDLIMQSTTVSPTSVAAGSAVSFSSYVYNQGNSVASSSSVGFYFSTDATLDASDQLLTSQYGAALAAGTYSSRTGTAAIPASTAAGNYYILFVADYQNQVAEVNETNNVSAVSLTVVPAGPDLTVNSQSLYSNSVAAGAAVTAYAYIYNQGNQTATSSNLGFYLSTNTTFDASDVQLSLSTGGALAAGGSSSRSGTLTIPAATAAGTYYVLFVADPSGAVTESNENNNVVYSSLTVYTPSIDLTISSGPSVSPTSVTPGNSVTTTSYLYNQGNTPASSAAVGYYLSTNTTLDASDVLLGSTSGNYVSAGSYTYVSGTAYVPTGTASGTYYVLFVADYLNQITETNKNNNVSYTTLQVTAPYIDLTIYNTPSISPASVAPGSSVSAGCYLGNQGPMPVTSVGVGYYLSTNTTLDASDVLIGNTGGTNVAANSYTYVTGTATVPTGTPGGTYYVLFVADYLNLVTESNKNNNVSYTTLQVVAPFVDLTIQSPYVAQYQIAIGNVFNASCNLYNQGNLAATPATVGYYLSTDNTFSANDILVGNTTYSSLAAGAYNSPSSSPMIPANTPPGIYYVLFVADYLNQVAEGNENNNVSAYYYTIQVTAPDLYIQSGATLSTSSVNSGGSLNSTAYIANKGTAAATSSAVGYYLSTNTTFDASDVALTATTYSSGALNAGSSSFRNISLTVPAGTAGGSYYVLIVADPLNLVAEADKTNNVTALALTVIAPFTGTVVPTTGSTILTSCSEKVADNGGNSNYTSNSDGILVIKPATTGMVSRLTFTSFSTEPGNDILYVYDGTSTSAPLLGQYSGTTLPAAITATNASGALTLRFKSDANTESTGFEASVSCVMILAAREQTAGYDVSVVPNPVASAAPLRVQLSGLGASCAATLTLRNSLGQLVSSQPFALAPGRLNQAQVATTGLASGVYILQLTGTDLNVVRRVVVE